MRVVTAVVAVVVVVALATMAQASPLDLKQVAADAKWVAHLDVDAMKASSVVQKAHQKHLERHPNAEKHLAKISKLIGMNPAEDLHGVTLYGSQLKKHTGVVIVQAKVDREYLLKKAKEAPDYRTSTYGAHTLHTWTHDKGGRHEHSVTGAFHKTNLILFGHLTSFLEWLVWVGL